MEFLQVILLLLNVLPIGAYTLLSDRSLRSIPRPGKTFDINTGSILAPILQPRVSGTPGSLAVLQHFVDWFQTNLPDWKLTFQNSSTPTPESYGQPVPFVNLIATRDPPWAQQEGEVGRLVLAAHYDSKMFPEGFIGAIDSAAPCAMLMHAALSIDAALSSKWAAVDEMEMLDEHKGIQLLFIDGEEAVHDWTDQDSLYGARALAKEWDETKNPVMSPYSSPLASIDLFVLLDLLGSPGPRIPSFFKTTHWSYQSMSDVERRLRKIGSFKSNSKPFLYEPDKSDSSMWGYPYIGDDHVPFMLRGVQVLHVIPGSFPPVWHHMEDDGEHLDMPTTEDWAVLTAAFAAEYLDLEGFMQAGKTVKKDAKWRKTEL